jgi:hypothetical protein
VVYVVVLLHDASILHDEQVVELLVVLLDVLVNLVVLRSQVVFVYVLVVDVVELVYAVQVLHKLIFHREVF